MKSKFVQLKDIFGLVFEYNCAYQRRRNSDLGKHEIALLDEDMENISTAIVKAKMDLMVQASEEIRGTKQWSTFVSSLVVDLGGLYI